MYDRAIAEQLRTRGHDVVAVTERADLRGLRDAELLLRIREEGRVIATEDADHFLPIFMAMLTAGEATSGLLLSSPRSMPRSTKTIGLFVRSLDRFLSAHPGEDALRDRVDWLVPETG